eukprot:CAMPEP_0118650534 /NCGR_PEP_ID=MMETSP0785-20121206/10298_1 /TAXON_ID=91992 /ORGANISM="Bolidomonas pacifica, Strain CCMP 1866" /LENGTH=392 /DNA_ID=CAMNT_0006542915 /DNA_START=33 /DNA_END=1207 /DNA_ORIENTATION=+
MISSTAIMRTWVLVAASLIHNSLSFVHQNNKFTTRRSTPRVFATPENSVSSTVPSTVPFNIPIFDPAGFEYTVPTSSLSPPRYWQLKQEVHKSIFTRGSDVGGEDGGGEEITFGYLCRSDFSSPTFGVSVGDVAVLCRGVVEVDVEEDDSGGEDIVVRVSPVLDEETATAPRRVSVGEVINSFPYSTCSVSSFRDDDGSLSWSPDAYVEGMLDLMVNEALADGVESEMTEEEVDEIIETITGEWGSIVEGYNEIEYKDPSARRWHMACDGIELLDLENREAAPLLETKSGVGRMKELENIVKRKNNEVKLKEGRGVDLEVSEVLGIPEAAHTLAVGNRVEYYWNPEWEWCAATVMGKSGPVGGEYIVELKFDADGEVHKVSFGGDDKGRWRP